MHKNPDIAIRKVPPATFLVDITKCYNNKKESLLEIDEMGCILWDLIKEGISREQLCLQFLNMLTDEKTAEFVRMVTNDVHEFLDIMEANGMVFEEDQL